FYDSCNEYPVSDHDQLAKLPRYCSRNIDDAIKSFKAWQDKDYQALRKTILKEYKDHDSYQRTYSLQFLERYKSIVRTEKDDILQYCRHFNMIAKVLIQRNVLSAYTAGVWF